MSKNGERHTEPVSRESANLVAERIGQLKALFPDAVSEGKVDFDKLRSILGDGAAAGAERFSFGWAGRADAVALLQTPSRATLVPCPEESVAFDTTKNLFVEGDNLEVLKLLYKAYAGKVKLIYIDPPYNTGQDFIYPDNFADPLAAYLQMTGQQDAAGNLLTSNPETSGRYHSAWLSMMFPRLFLARQLLRDDGVIFVSIDDHEVHHLRLLMNEIFGEENFVGVIIWKGATDNNPTQIATEHEYLLCYAHHKSELPSEWKNKTHHAKETMLAEYRSLAGKLGDDVDAIQHEFRKFIKRNKEALVPLTHYDRVDARGPYTGSRKVHNPKPGGYKYKVFHPQTKGVCVPPANGYRYPEEGMKELLAEGKILFGEDETQIIQIKEYLEEFEGKLSSVIHLDSRVGSNQLAELFPGDGKVFTNPKPVSLLADIFSFVLQDGDVLMDFFAGSGSSAQAVLEMNREDGGHRHFMLVQLPEPTGNSKYRTIAEIGKERIRRVIAKLQKAREGELPLSREEISEDLGFKVFKLGESNFESRRGTAERDAKKYHEEMNLFVDPLRAGWTPGNVLWEVAIKEGYGLNSVVEPVERALNTVYRVTDPERDPPQSFRACLDDVLNPDIAKALALTREDLFVCRDRALDDTLAANLALQCRLKTI